MNYTRLTAAQTLVRAGIRVFPIEPGTKKPQSSPSGKPIKWSKYANQVPSTKQLQQWFGKYDVGVICGAPSGNLLVIDLDDPDIIDPFVGKIRDEHPDLYDHLVEIKTRSGKRHLWLLTAEPFGARQTFGTYGDGKDAIEFRADGCYVVGPGSEGYVIIRGDIDDLATYQPNEVDELIKVTESFGPRNGKRAKTKTKSNAEAKTIMANASTEFGDDKLDSSRPGDDFAMSVTWDYILTELLDPPYTLVREDEDDQQYWLRPGGESECSVHSGLCSDAGRDLMHVFSTGCEFFQADETYSKFGAYAAIFHGGDCTAAAKDLREQGYGKQDVAHVATDLVTTIKAYSTLTFRPVEWLWDQRIPVGYICNLSGDPGCGKGHLMAEIAAHVTAGTDWPDGETCPVGDVLIISDEDGADDTIGPRCQRHGADLTRVHEFAIQTREGLDVHLDLSKHVDLLRQQFSRFENLKLVFFDPLSAYLGQIDSHSNSNVRGVLNTVGQLARDLRFAIIGIGHFGKGEKRAITRTLGSIAFTAKARVEWQAGIHPDDDQLPDGKKRRLLLPAKNNLGSSPGLGYRISGPRDASVLTWEHEPVFESANIFGNSPAKTLKIDKAVCLIEDLLAEHDGRVDLNEVRELSRKQGISEETLRRARRELKLDAKCEDGVWIWFLGGS